MLPMSMDRRRPARLRRHRQRLPATRERPYPRLLARPTSRRRLAPTAIGTEGASNFSPGRVTPTSADLSAIMCGSRDSAELQEVHSVCH